MLDTLLYNATVLTLNSDFAIHRPGMVGVQEGRIKIADPWEPKAALPEARTAIDVEGAIVMPGLVNAHTHLPMVLFRGLADDLPLMTWLNDYMFPAEARHVRPDTVRSATQLACAELLLSGTTTCCDGYFHASAVAEAVRESGIRAVLGQGVIDFPAPGVPDPKQNIDKAREFVDQWQSIDPKISTSIFCHAPYTCSEKTLKQAKAAAAELGVLFQIHVAETRSEVEQFRSKHGTTPVRYLDRIGVLDDRTLVVHGVWLDAEDIRALAKRECPVVHCPESNMKLGSGIAPVAGLIEAGVTVALGTDGAASNNDLDLFREMDTVAKLHKLATGEPIVADARTVLRMATLRGASAIGLDHEVGSFEVGKAADLVVLDPCHPALVPDFHPESLVVYAADGSAVKDVMVAGRFLVKDRRLLHMDLEKIMDTARNLARGIADASGLPG